MKDALTDIGLWGHLIISAIGLTPVTPLSTCESRLISLVNYVLFKEQSDLPTVIKPFHSDVFAANALAAPPYVLQCIVMVAFVYHSDRIR